MEYWNMRKNKNQGHPIGFVVPIANLKSKIEKVQYSSTPMLRFPVENDKLWKRTKETVNGYSGRS